jgi:SEC-C motif-containing protein
MRSRYSAFVLGEARYLLDTWHPSTRPRRLTLDPDIRWTGLQVLHAQGGPFETEGVVEFRASWVGGAQQERSTFVREAGRWYYVAGTLSPDAPRNR